MFPAKIKVSIWWIPLSPLLSSSPNRLNTQSNHCKFKWRNTIDQYTCKVFLNGINLYFKEEIDFLKWSNFNKRAKEKEKEK